MRPLWLAWGPEQNTVLEVEHVLEKSFLDLGKSLDSPLQVRCLLPFRHRQRHAQGRKRWRQGLSLAEPPPPCCLPLSREALVCCVLWGLRHGLECNRHESAEGM
jgi:hypothetical protein